MKCALSVCSNPTFYFRRFCFVKSTFVERIRVLRTRHHHKFKEPVKLRFSNKEVVAYSNVRDVWHCPILVRADHLIEFSDCLFVGVYDGVQRLGHTFNISVFTNFQATRNSTGDLPNAFWDGASVTSVFKSPAS